MVDEVKSFTVPQMLQPKCSDINYCTNHTPINRNEQKDKRGLEKRNSTTSTIGNQSL